MMAGGEMQRVFGPLTERVELGWTVRNCLIALFGRAHLSRQHSPQLTQDAVGFTRPEFRDLIRAPISCMTISGRRRASA